MISIRDGTFAYRNMYNEVKGNPYTFGAISQNTHLSHMLEKHRSLDAVGYEYLTPFELILGLEMLREKTDRDFGIDPTNSPYATLMADSL